MLDAGQQQVEVESVETVRQAEGDGRGFEADGG